MRRLLFGLLTISLLHADGLIPHLAVGQGWTTTITVVNTTAFSQPTIVWFWDKNGSALNLNVTGLGTYPGFTITLPPRGMGIAELTSDSNTLNEGYASVVGRTVAGNAIFRWRVTGKPDFEASVPISSAVEDIVFPFDNSNGSVMGIALVNQDPGNALVSVVIRDSSGTTITNTHASSVSHQAYQLPDVYPETANTIGTIEFTAYSVSDTGTDVPRSSDFSYQLAIQPHRSIHDVDASIRGQLAVKV